MSASGMVATIRRRTTRHAVCTPTSVTKKNTGVPERMNSTCSTKRNTLTFTRPESKRSVRCGMPPAQPTATSSASRAQSAGRLSVRNAATHVQNAKTIFTMGFSRCTTVAPGA